MVVRSPRENTKIVNPDNVLAGRTAVKALVAYSRVTLTSFRTSATAIDTYTCMCVRIQVFFAAVGNKTRPGCSGADWFRPHESYAC